jgi:hypothetical protein
MFSLAKPTAPLIGTMILLVAITTRADRPLSFNRDVRPILSDRCYACHGFDEKKREAELRLDTVDGATAARDSGAAIVPHQPDKSQLLDRVQSSDPDQKMPPPTSNKAPLTPAEIDILRRWIAQGAEYQQHWAFLPIARPDPPTIESASPTISQPIDRFVLSAIKEHGGAGLAPPASKERLLRRVTFDLTGLPPTLADIERFLADTSQSAYETAVDRLLASPTYGERMATDWLDAARFADTHGYQMDRERQVWPYRDWVINAFNENLPYSDFVRWQLAGDLLPNPTRQQRLATAFNRLHSQNEEGGIVEEEFRVAYVVDRVTTFGTVFLGLTLECSRCHDHKYDPITAKEFYSLFSFFQNIPEPGQTSYFTPDMPTPALILSTPEQDAQLAAIDAQIDAKQSTLAAVTDRQAFEQWLAQPPSEPALPGKQAEFRFESLDQNKLINDIDPNKPGNGVDSPTLVAGPAGHGQAGLLLGDNGFDFPGIGHFHRAQPFSISLWIKQPKPSPRAVVLHHSRAPADAASRGYDLLLEEGKPAFGLYYMWPGSAVKVRTQQAIAPDTWTHVVLTYDGSGKGSGLAIYLDGQPAPIDLVADHLTKDITYGGGEPNLSIGYRFRDNGFRDGAVDDLIVFDRAVTPLEAAHLAGKDDFKLALTTRPLDPQTQEKLYQYFLSTVSQPWKTAQQELLAARDAKRKLLAPIPEIMVMDELPNPKPASILIRGNYDQPGEPVTANTPAVLPPFPTQSPRNRLGLADWLLDTEHPLMARVTVNRYWQLIFGKGLVETADNLGTQGSPPTHPELLDWLARDFVRHGWDVKRLIKQLVMSQTYQQESVVSDWAREHDADNKWLSHASPRILSAEMMRDQALATSGLLAPRIGGPSVKPYQPDGLWAIAMGNPAYDTSQGDDLYRRSLYTYWKRTVPPPTMMTLDAADRSYCTVRRQSTNTPLQSLVLLNDPQFVEAARCTAQRMVKEGGATAADRLTWLFRSITSRHPTASELAILEAGLAEQKEIFAADTKAAQSLIAVGQKPADTKIDLVELAAATVIAQALFNHDESVRRR